jgi:hypothetical protein
MTISQTLYGLALLSLFGMGSTSLARVAFDDQGSHRYPPMFYRIADNAAGPRLADDVKAANARFQNVLAATAEGYAPLTCVSGADGGALGVQYVNLDYAKDSRVDLGRPVTVIYQAVLGGGLELAGVEYVALKDPGSLEGHRFNFVDTPNRYGLGSYFELHVWAWKRNPGGPFADMVPNAPCDKMPTRGL